MKLLEGYVENRTKEVALAAIFGALLVATRPIRIPIAPGIVISFSAVFGYFPATIFSWFFTWGSPILAAYTGTVPLRSFLAVSAGSQVAYFLIRLLPRRKWARPLSLVLAVYVANIVGTIYWNVVGGFPLSIAIPAFLIKATVSSVTCVILVAPISKAFELMGIVDYERTETN